MDHCDIEWFALETNGDHSLAFEIASKYCILDSFVDHDGHSISSEGFLPAVVDFRVTLFIVNIPVLGRFCSVLTELFLGAVCALYTRETLVYLYRIELPYRAWL